MTDLFKLIFGVLGSMPRPSLSATKIALTLLCRNEADIVGRNIEFHLATGVDFIIVTDNSSDDETVRVVENYVRQGRVELIHQPRLTHDQAIWVTEMARRAALRGADWVINSDADEFWWPANGTLRSALSTVPSSVLALEVKRNNFPPCQVGGPDFVDRMIYRDAQSLNSLGMPLPSKIIHRASSDVEVEDGNHAARFSNRIVNPAPADDIEILHFPMRSFEQFSRKVILGTAALESNTRIDSTVGGTWRHIYHQYYKTGQLRDYYLRHELTDDVIRRRIGDETLIADTRLRDFIARTRLPAAVPI